MNGLDKSGFGLIGFILIFALLIFAATKFSDSVPDFTVENTDGSTAAGESTQSNDVQTLTLSLQQDLLAEGKAVRSYSQGEFSLTISAALPALEDGGYYEAYLDGPSKKYLGLVTKDGATYTLNYTAREDLRSYRTVQIVVDGPDDLINQPIPLPFVILEGEFPNI